MKRRGSNDPIFGSHFTSVAAMRVGAPRVLFVLAFVCCVVAFDGCGKGLYQVGDGELFGDIAPGDYLLGMFNPTNNSLFSPVSSFGIDWENDYIGYIRDDVGTALAAMIQAFEADNPSISLPVVSATRNYTKQEEIWTNKWFNVYENITQPIDRALAILQFSSKPGTSRHHWGTDVDLYALENYYFDFGDGKVIYSWLTENAASFGFCQPYTDGRCAGYQEEKWHWSYQPLSSIFLRDWVLYYEFQLCRYMSKVHFPGSQEGASMLAPVYVQSINCQCKAPLHSYY